MALSNIHKILTEKRKTLAFAESCTGGRLAAQITAMPGASAYFLGSLVVYSEALKRDLLGVPAALLREKGAVSKEVAEAMLQGLFEVTQADYGIAVTGIAGPTGGSKAAPIGTIWAAVGERGKPFEAFTFLVKEKGREEILLTACARLFDELAGLLL